MSKITLPGLTKVPTIDKGASQLVLGQPFFGSLIMRSPRIEDTEAKTISTNGKNIVYNPAWTNTLTSAQATGALANQAAKIGFLHSLRMGSRDPELWSMACNLAVNPILKDGGLTLPPDSVDEKRFHGMSAEKIYDQLKKEIESGQTQVKFASGNKQGNDNAKNKMNGQGWGDVEKHPANGQGEQSAAEAEARLAVLQAAQAAKNKGKLPAAFEGLIEEFRKPKVDWRERLRTFIGGNKPDDYSFRRPNRKHMALHGAYLPTIEYRGAGTIVVGIDSSGSVGAAEMEQFMGEIKAIHEETAPDLMILIYCDAAIAKETRYLATDIFDDTKRYAAGGTQLSPVFHRVTEIGDTEGIVPDSFIFLTDLEVWMEEFKGIDPKYPVLWVSTSRTEAPFGEVVKIEVGE